MEYTRSSVELYTQKIPVVNYDLVIKFIYIC